MPETSTSPMPDSQGIAALVMLNILEGFPIGEPVEYDYSQYQHQVPGGMISNLRYQLRRVGMENKIDQTLEEAAQVRAEICAGLGWLGVERDPAANVAHVGGREGRIYRAGSRLELWVIPTDEELLIARDAYRVVAGVGRSSNSATSAGHR